MFGLSKTSCCSSVTSGFFAHKCSSLSPRLPNSQLPVQFVSVRSMNKTSRRTRRRRAKCHGKHVHLREGMGRMWQYQTMNHEFDTTYYLPLMNKLRNEGHWLPHWVDLHPLRKAEDAPDETKDDKHKLAEWFNSEGFNDPKILDLRERSQPHLRKPGIPPPCTPPRIRRSEVAEPSPRDFKLARKLERQLGRRRIWKVGDVFSISRMLR